jgi:uncharacterized protein
VEFEWDEAKRASNLLKHRLDFVQVVLLFDQPHLTEPARNASGEERFKVIGRLGDDHVTAICTWRGEAVRVISLRKARKGERQQYQALLGG